MRNAAMGISGSSTCLAKTAIFKAIKKTPRVWVADYVKYITNDPEVTIFMTFCGRDSRVPEPASRESAHDAARLPPLQRGHIRTLPDIFANSTGVGANSELEEARIYGQSRLEPMVEKWRSAWQGAGQRD